MPDLTKPNQAEPQPFQGYTKTTKKQYREKYWQELGLPNPSIAQVTSRASLEETHERSGPSFKRAATTPNVPTVEERGFGFARPFMKRAETMPGVSTAPKEEGKQEKAPDSGYYERDGRLYYIKKSQEFPADDIAEVATAHLLTLAITPERAVMYSAIPHQHLNGSVYLASEVESSFKPLKSVVKEKAKEKAEAENLPYEEESLGLPDPVFGADLLTDPNKNVIYKILQEARAEQGMAEVLAGCLWTNENDCQYANILIEPPPTGDNISAGRVKKFDNGWGLEDICKPGNARVKVFKERWPIGEVRATHARKLEFGKGMSGFVSGLAPTAPTNHFNDYPKIIRSQHFVDALETVLKRLTPGEIDKEVMRMIPRIQADYKGANPGIAIDNFAKHIGLDLNKKDKGHKNQTDVEYIQYKLKKRLKERADSMAVFKCLLKIDLALNDENKKISKETIKLLLSELQNEILSRFTKENGYNIEKLTVGAIIPPFDPSRDKLMQKLMIAAGQNGMTDTNEPELFALCKVLSKGGKKQELGSLLSVERLQKPEKKPMIPVASMALPISQKPVAPLPKPKEVVPSSKPKEIAPSASKQSVLPTPEARAIQQTVPKQPIKVSPPASAASTAIQQASSASPQVPNKKPPTQPVLPSGNKDKPVIFHDLKHLEKHLSYSDVHPTEQKPGSAMEIWKRREREELQASGKDKEKKNQQEAPKPSPTFRGPGSRGAGG